MAAVSEAGELVGCDTRSLSDVSRGYTYFAEGDVLLAKITPCFENGKAVHLRKLTHGVGFGSTEFHVLRSGPEIDGRYLFYAVWNQHFRAVGARNMTGTAGQKRLPPRFVSDYKIALPALPEQRRIAAILDKADGLRRKRQQSLAMTDEFLRAAFLEMFGDPVTNPKGWPTVSLNETFAEDPRISDAALARRHRRRR
jgi:type I restriction enzyme S subunit